jgi:uncharacterized protein (DUF697 family)
MSTKKQTQNDTKSASDKENKAMAITRRYMLWSGGAGLIPFPIIDLATIIGVQMKMVSEISDVYGVGFSENTAKNTISAALSGVTASTFAQGTLGSSIKSIPLIGTLVGTITMPFFASASAYALGNVFINHFENGGTFLDLDPSKFADNFKKMFSLGEKAAKDLKSEVEKPTEN